MPQAPIPAILKFVNNIDLSSPSLIPDLRTKIPSFPAENISPNQHSTFETTVTKLWNLATRQSRAVREGDISDDEKTKLALLRAFAFGMLDSVGHSRNNKMKKGETCVRMLKVAFKCMKSCIDAGELDFASKVAQRAVWWIDQGEEVMPEDLKTKLNGEYFLWRMTLVSAGYP
jgi:hypothetical protein